MLAVLISYNRLIWLGLFRGQNLVKTTYRALLCLCKGNLRDNLILEAAQEQHWNVLDSRHDLFARPDLVAQWREILCDRHRAMNVSTRECRNKNQDDSHRHHFPDTEKSVLQHQRRHLSSILFSSYETDRHRTAQTLSVDHDLRLAQLFVREDPV